MAVLLQAPSLWNVQGSITVVGILLVAVVALYLGFVTPKYAVLEIRTRLKEREAENAVLSENNIRRIEENAELRGQLMMLRQELETMRNEIQALRAELGHYRAGQGPSGGMA